MYSILILLIFVIGISARESHTGNLFFFTNRDKPTFGSLRVANDYLFGGKWSTVFKLNHSTSLQDSKTRKYLAVNDRGQLCMNDKPHIGFFISLDNGTQSHKSLSYKGNEVFHICNDQLIDLGNGCEGARECKILYEPMST